MFKRLLLSASICVLTVSSIFADLIGGALNLARSAVDTAAKVTEDATDVVDDATYPARWHGTSPYGNQRYLIDRDFYRDENSLNENVRIEKKITQTPDQVIVEKTITKL